LQETEHFCRWRQEKVAKIVPYGYQDMSKIAGNNFSGLSFFSSGVHNCTDTQTSAGNQGSVPAIEIPINRDGVAEIAKPQNNDAHNVNTKPGGDSPCSLETFPGNELSLNRSSGCCALL
jgi:hypothetical protein